MGLGVLARCFLPLLAGVPPDVGNPFEHRPFTLPTFRDNLGLLPLAADDQSKLYEDDSLDGSPVTGCAPARDGFCFRPEVMVGLSKTTAPAFTEDSLRRANKFYGVWLWSELKRLRTLKLTVPKALDKIDLVDKRTKLVEGRTDHGWGEYRALIIGILNRTGGIMKIVEEIMARHRATPAERWRDAREENRSRVDGAPLPEHKVPYPAPGAFTSSIGLIEEVSEAVFGPEVANSRGSVDSMYQEASKVLIGRAWQNMQRRLNTAVQRSQKLCKEMDVYLADAKESGNIEDVEAAIEKLKTWRRHAERSLEVEDPVFLDRQAELEVLVHTVGEEALKAAQQPKSRGAGAQVGRSKSGSLLPTEEQVAVALERWNNYCQSLKDDQNCPVPVGEICAPVDLLEEDDEIGTKDFKGMTEAELWADLGLPGATNYPFSPPDVRIKWHQIVGMSFILKGAFTKALKEAARPTLLCDNVGLGKTLQVISSICMVTHLLEQQESCPEKCLVPPPLAAKNGTPYFAGLERIPQRAHLIASPRTLSRQWMEQVKKFTVLGNFHVLCFSSEQGPLDRFFSNPHGEYRKAAGPNNENAGRVIILADMSAIAKEAARCFKAPIKRGGQAAQLRTARGDPEALQPRAGVRLEGTIFGASFNLVAFDESHALRNVSLINLAAIWIASRALVCVGATATPIFTGPKDIASQGRVLRHKPFIGGSGEKLLVGMMNAARERTKEWDEHSKDIINQQVVRETQDECRKAGALNDPERLAKISERVKRKYQSEDQLKILKSTYVACDQIQTLRRTMRPVIIRRTAASKDADGNRILAMEPPVEVIAWSPLSPREQAGVDLVNEVQLEQRKSSSSKAHKADQDVLKWSKFLLDHKHAGLHPDILPLQQQEAEQNLKPGTLLNQMTNDWDKSNIAVKASTRLLKLEEVITHYWEGNPKPPVYMEDGSRDFEAEAQLPDPPLLDRPRKFLVYVHYKLHRKMAKKLLQIQGRSSVEYDGSMSTPQREAAIAKFETDPDCRIMLISNVGAAGLNLTAASVVIFVSGVWSGQEDHQIIGHPALAGYANSKTAMSDNFLQSQRELRSAHQAFLELAEAESAEGDSDEELTGDWVNAATSGRKKPQRSAVAPRQQKQAEDKVSGEANSVVQPATTAPSRKRKVEAKPNEGQKTKRSRSGKAAPVPSLGSPVATRSVPSSPGSAPPPMSSRLTTATDSRPLLLSQGVGMPSGLALQPSKEEQPVGKGKAAKRPRSASPHPEPIIALPTFSDEQLVDKPSKTSLILPTTASVEPRKSSGLQPHSIPQAGQAKYKVQTTKRARTDIPVLVPPPEEFSDPDVDVVGLSPSSSSPKFSSPLPPAFKQALQSPSPSRVSPPLQPPPLVARVSESTHFKSQSRPQPMPKQGGVVSTSAQDLFDLSHPLCAPGTSALGRAAAQLSPPLQDRRDAGPPTQRLTPRPGTGQRQAEASSKPHRTLSDQSQARARSPATVEERFSQKPYPAHPTRRSPPRHVDSPMVWQEKMNRIVGEQRGTTAPNRASGSRLSSTVKTMPTGTSNATPLMTSAARGSDATDSQAPGPSQARSKTSGFIKRSAATSLGPKKAVKGGATTMLLDQRDKILDRSSGELRSPSRAPRKSVFSEDH